MSVPKRAVGIDQTSTNTRSTRLVKHENTGFLSMSERASASSKPNAAGYHSISGGAEAQPRSGHRATPKVQFVVDAGSDDDTLRKYYKVGGTSQHIFNEQQIKFSSQPLSAHLTYGHSLTPSAPSMPLAEPKSANAVIRDEEPSSPNVQIQTIHWHPLQQVERSPDRESGKVDEEITAF